MTKYCRSNENLDDFQVSFAKKLSKNCRTAPKNYLVDCRKSLKLVERYRKKFGLKIERGKIVSILTNFGVERGFAPLGYKTKQ